MKKLLAGCAVAALATSAAHAQETTSTIRGTVTSGGTAVAGASVTILHVPSGTRAVSTTDASGAFSASGLRIGGPFTVTIAAPGYATSSVTDIQTVATQPYDLPVELTGEGQEIVVTATRVPGAQTVSQGPATVLTARDIANIATVNRDIRDLSRRDPFARLDDSPSGGRAISFAGQNARYNKFSVDGVPITDNFGLNPDGLPSRRSPIPLDAIGQFQAKVAPYDVREGNFQGGAINIILRSGTNQFQGTGFYAYQGDGIFGDRTKGSVSNPSGKISIPKFHTNNYGAELSGPIIKDKLFFMLAGERIRGGFPLAEGPGDNNAGNPIPTLLQSQVSAVVAAAQAYGGGYFKNDGVQTSSGDKDDRLVGKLDANLSDTQRFSLTGTYAKDAININSSNTFTTGTPGLSLASNNYIQGNQLYTGVAQLNSEWSDEFSTEARGFYKHYKRLQDPLFGRGFAQFRVCDALTSDRQAAAAINAAGAASTTQATNCASGNAVISIGPDNSRQTNQLHSETWGGLLQARLTRDGHDLRVFGSFEDTRIFNSFVQNSAGNYYFDSIADLIAGNAQSLTYTNAVPSTDPDDAAARFRYQSYAFGIQDTWQVGPTFNLSDGARYDLFGGHSRAALSPSFTGRYAAGANVMGEVQQIGPNNAYIDGRGVFQPRIGFDWKPIPRLSVRGGGGIFAGGTPDVYVSNSFSNTGILTNSITIRQQNNGLYTGVNTQATGVAALTGVTGTSIPDAVNTYLKSGTVSSTATTNALDPRFKIPSQWRATLSFDYDANLGPLGDHWRFGADALYSKVREQVYFTDIRSTPIAAGLANALTPDGRQRYASLTSFGDSNSDILLTNTKKGRSYIGVARFDKDFDFGLNLYGSFTYQDVKDQAPATSSTAGSNYANGAFLDPNNVQYGISNDQVKYFFKYGATFDHAFFSDYKTTFALFGESRIGHPYSFTFQDPASGRSPDFGTIGTATRYLLYVPTFGNDPKVSYDTAAHQQQIENYFQAMGFGKYQGKDTKRNAFHSPWFTRLDLHVSQEIPTGLFRSRITVFGDVENFTNLINRKWGQIAEYAFPYNIAAVKVQCLTTPVATGAAAGTVTAATATSTAQNCAQYRYTPAITDSSGAFSAPTETVYARQSLYSIRVGVRFTF